MSARLPTTLTSAQIRRFTEPNVAMDAERRKTSTGTTWMDHELGILRFEYTPGAVCKLPDAKENIKHQVELTGGKVVPLLCDVTKAKEVDGESRAYYSTITA